jgi:putative protease
LRAAVANGADAVYFGLPRFNARLRAHNFTEAELPVVVAFCHQYRVKAYVALNTLVFTKELDDAEAYLRLLSQAGVDALIVQDVGLVRLARTIVPDLPIHASTQMTITSPEGVAFARELGIERVVLARELSLRELDKFRAADEGLKLPLEVFVHGALCVAYSGQCLTSESLGQRSANRGECAQACRMPYELIVDGALRDLGDKRYLLSPQDLAAVAEIPSLIDRGVVSFKIEGRLKSHEYVAAVCQVYRRALDAALGHQQHRLSATEKYQLEMTFSRGLFTGWMHGVDHQQLVSARFGKKRGPFVGRISKVGGDFVIVDGNLPLRPGDGIVFDTGGDTNDEQGGRVWQVQGRKLSFERGRIDFAALHEGDRVWKTDDPDLNKRLVQSFAGRIQPRTRAQVDLTVRGKPGAVLEVEAKCDSCASPITLASERPLDAARTAPLTEEKLREHLGRFGEHAFVLGKLDLQLDGDVILPIAELNRLRRELVGELSSRETHHRGKLPQSWRSLLTSASAQETGPSLRLSVLVRTFEQLEAAVSEGVETIYCDFEDIRRYADVVAQVRASSPSALVFLATPRIQKAGEQGFFRLIENAAPDGVLIRNLGAIDYFLRLPHFRRIGDFSLNVANPLTAQHFITKGLERVTASYDLNAEQVLDMLSVAPPDWFELTIHQHMPMFHMEHCVFAAFLSKGSSHLDCGRPCDRHRVHLRDRVGIEHPLRADVGCRNTLFNAVPQTGANYFDSFARAGLKHFRVELLEEDRLQSQRVISAYQRLLKGERLGDNLWRELGAQSQLGVTRGTLA